MNIERIEIEQEITNTFPLHDGAKILEVDVTYRVGAIAEGKYWHGYYELFISGVKPVRVGPITRSCLEDHTSMKAAFSCARASAKIGFSFGACLRTDPSLFQVMMQSQEKQQLDSGREDDGK